VTTPAASVAPAPLPPNPYTLAVTAHRHPDDEPAWLHDQCADCASWNLRRMCPDCIYYALS
jgi:hypothetical protein